MGLVAGERLFGGLSARTSTELDDHGAGLERESWVVPGTRVIGHDHLIVRATAADVDVVLTLRDDAARWMVERGIDQWRPAELPRSLIEDRLAHGGVFLLLRPDREVVGTVTVTWSDETTWGERPVDAGYVHMLVVAAPLRGTGTGRALLDWAEGYIAAAGKRWSRLDCVRTNRALGRWYESAGYRHVGDHEFTGPAWASPVALYEKRLHRGT